MRPQHQRTGPHGPHLARYICVRVGIDARIYGESG